MSLTFEGDSLPEAVRRELVPVREEASVDEDLLEDSRGRITTWLQERGYWRARVSYTRRQTADRPRGGVHHRARPGLSRAVAGDWRHAGPPRAVPPAAGRARGRRAVRTVGARRRCRGHHPALPEQWLSCGARRAGARRRQCARRCRPTSTARSTSGCGSSRARGAGVGHHLRGRAALDESRLRSALTIAPGSRSRRPPSSRAARPSSAATSTRATARRRSRPARHRRRAGAIGVTFMLVEGRQTLVDRILVVGNVRTSEDTIRRELRIARGQPFGLSRVFESQRRLTALGLFRASGSSTSGRPTPQPRRRHHRRGGAGHDGGLRRRPAGRPAAAHGRRTARSTRPSSSPRAASSRLADATCGERTALSACSCGPASDRVISGDPERDGSGLASTISRARHLAGAAGVPRHRQPRLTPSSSRPSDPASVSVGTGPFDWSRLFGERTDVRGPLRLRPHRVLRRPDRPGRPAERRSTVPAGPPLVGDHVGDS